MSGGVDSSVVAALAARTGAEVIGVTLQLYDHGEAVEAPGTCCAGQDIYDAGPSPTGSASPIMSSIMKAASATSVIDQFADEYARGRTPVPCSLCNQGVKFIDLLAFARDLGADCLATGHYVRRVVNGRAAPSCTGAPIRRATRAISCSRRPASSSTFCASRSATCPSAAVREIARGAGLDGRRQARQPGHLLRPRRRLCRGGARRSGPRPRRRARSSISTGACSASIAASIHFTVGQRRGHRDRRPGRAALRGAHRAGERRRGGRPAPRAGGRGDARRADQLARRGPGGRSTVKVRSLARPVPARHRRRPVHFERPEYGVAPGQAAVFYEGDAVARRRLDRGDNVGRAQRDGCRSRLAPASSCSASGTGGSRCC